MIIFNIILMFLHYSILYSLRYSSARYNIREEFGMADVIELMRKYNLDASINDFSTGQKLIRRI